MMRLTRSRIFPLLCILLAALLMGCAAPETTPADGKGPTARTEAGKSADPAGDPAAAGRNPAGDPAVGGSNPAAAATDPTGPPGEFCDEPGYTGKPTVTVYNRFATSEPVDVEGVRASPPALMDETADPYFVLFMQLFEEDPGLNGDIRYIAVDLNTVKATDCTAFLVLMADFCAKQGVELLEDDVEGLTEKGLVKDMTFRDGIVFIPSDVSLTDTRLVSKAQKWRSGDGAIGATYTVEKKREQWVVTRIVDPWIS